MRTLICCVLVLIPGFGFAQNLSDESLSACARSDENIPELTMMGKSRLQKSLPASGSIKGSPYLTLEYVDISFVNTDGLRKTQKMRYNVLANHFEVKACSLPELIPGVMVQEFEYMMEGSERHRFVNSNKFKSLGVQEAGFFEVIMQDEISLYGFEKMRVKESPGNEDGFPSSYKYGSDQVYYLKVNDQLLQIASFNKKGLAAFGEREAVMRSFIKKNKLKFKNPEDVIKMATYYQTLL